MVAPATVSPAEYWHSYDTFDVTDLQSALAAIASASEGPSPDWVWRGIRNAGWGLHSSLAREAKATTGQWVDEAGLRAIEDALVKKADDWGLHRHPTGPLSGLELLAALQHTGAPTRLVDVSHSALVALWFATESDASPGCTKCAPGCGCGGATPDSDGRVFAIDVSQRHLEASLPAWLASLALPWVADPNSWTKDYFVWTPAPFEPRMAAQHGGFLVGPIPSGPHYGPDWYVNGHADERLSVEQVKSIVSLSLRCHGPLGGPGRPAAKPVRTFRVAAAAKATIRQQLDDMFDLSYRTLFPDLAGFSMYRDSP